MQKTKIATENCRVDCDDLNEIDTRLQKLHQQLDGVNGAVRRCTDEPGFNETQQQQRQATRDYFMYFFGPAPRVGP